MGGGPGMLGSAGVHEAMKEHLMDLVRGALTPAHGRNLAREYLQAQILASLQRAGAMIPLAFHGGTALRFLYGIPRYSEDLDFALECTAEEYDFRRYLRAVQRDMTSEGYVMDLKVSDQKVVHGAFVRFAGLLHEMGLSQQPGEVLSVKVEVDTRPPAGAVVETSVVRRHMILQLQHHDRASLLAGKLHALLQRRYAKGRDLYDLLWYLSDPAWPAPNLILLNNALRQTDWAGPELTAETWRQSVRERLQGLAWDRVVADVRPFLEPGTDPGLLTLENLLRLLG